MEVDYQNQLQGRLECFFPSQWGGESCFPDSYIIVFRSTFFWFGRFWQLHPGNSANSAQDAPFSAQVLVVVIAFFPQQMAFRTLLPLLTLLLVALLGPAFTGAALRAAGFGAPRSSRVPRAADACKVSATLPPLTTP